MEIVKPFVKWAGGKGSLISQLTNFYPFELKDGIINKYVEPFVGGGAVLIDILQKYNVKSAYAFDINIDLINCYNVIKTNVEDLIEALKEKEENYFKLETENKQGYFYEIRKEYNSYRIDEQELNVKRASEFIFLNRTCFNGLYRVNSKNEFNVPFGKKTKVNTYEGQNLGIICGFLNYNDIKILSTDFEEAVKEAKKGDFIYFDPPYDSDTSTFNSYTEDGFGKEQQKRLAKVYRELSDKGCYVMLSNHNTELINELYKDYNIHLIEAKRSINANGKKRGKVEEVIITNYENKRGFDL